MKMDEYAPLRADEEGEAESGAWWPRDSADHQQASTGRMATSEC